ncbi:hypothetical protein LTR36_004809 [Oleoguttula mirabilis]|uniref:Uncharacterized protein n=1 Tax=Oleoguttula mirabilis TaxID=1507867 RepID=A0AAV9JF05_9PEZI|nr:hypothetical protein LTR36_004809 [Oleoguttula mirabilis]
MADRKRSGSPIEGRTPKKPRGHEEDADSVQKNANDSSPAPEAEDQQEDRELEEPQQEEQERDEATAPAPVFVSIALGSDAANGVASATLVAPRGHDNTNSQQGNGTSHHDHPNNSLNPRYPLGTAASRFWTACWDTLIDTIVEGPDAYDASEPSDHHDLRAIMAHPALSVSKPILKFAYKQRERVNMFEEFMWDPTQGFDTPPGVASLLFHVNFTFDVDLNDGNARDYGLHWELVDDVKTTFSDLRTAIFTIVFSNDVEAFIESGKAPVSKRFRQVRMFLRRVVMSLRDDFPHLKHKYVAVEDSVSGSVVNSDKCKTGDNNITIAQRILQKRGLYVEF